MVQKGEFKLRGKIFILTILIIFLLILVSFLTNYQIAESRHEKFETSEPDNILEDVDTDGDLLTDYDETYTTHTDPTNPDSDGDGVPDGQEYEFWEDYYSNEKDQDSPQWLKDLYPLYDREKRQGQYTSTGDLDDDNVPNIMDEDSDGDGLTDGFELANGLDPADPESNLEDLPKSWKYLRFRQAPDRNAIEFPNYIYGSGFPDDFNTFSYDSVLFTVEPAGYPRYWRTAVFDNYYHSGWRSDYDFEEYNNQDLEYEVEGYSDSERFSYTLTFETKWRGNIPTALHTTSVYDFEPALDNVDYNDSGVFKVNDYIESYSFNSSIYHFDYETLSEAQLPEIIDNDNLVAKNFIDDDIINLGKSIATEAASPFDKAYDIAEYLVENYVYDLNSYEHNYEVYLATSDGYSSGGDSYQNILETMLFKTGTGTCIDFATAFVFMCRANDIP
ncbi:MAG: transglutaminase domain-containing protein, partial [Thermoplasmata archaeon]|nr:transglutaminase domain-containing protein [Thermoplasmata archaeon]